MKCLLLFAAGGLCLGAVSLAVGIGVLGTESLLEAGAAYGLCLIPAVATLGWVVWSYQSAPEQQLTAGLGGSGIRMGIALGGGYLLTQMQPDNFGSAFWYWLTWFYLTLLALEITLLVRQQPSTDQSPRT